MHTAHTGGGNARGRFSVALKRQHPCSPCGGCNVLEHRLMDERLVAGTLTLSTRCVEVAMFLRCANVALDHPSQEWSPHLHVVLSNYYPIATVNQQHESISYAMQPFLRRITNPWNILRCHCHTRCNNPAEPTVVVFCTRQSPDEGSDCSQCSI